MNFKKLAVAAAALSFASSAFAAGIPAQKLDKSLHAKLPASIQKERRAAGRRERFLPSLLCRYTG